MHKLKTIHICVILVLAICLSGASSHGQNAKPTTTIRRVSLLEGNNVELEIAASGPISPRAQIVTRPDRLVLDFPNAVPAKGLHDIELDRGDLKGARIGLFSSKPMTTRVVLDLKSPQTYKLFPSGNTVIVKIGENASKSQVAAAKPADDDEETVISVEKPEGSEVTVLAKATPVKDSAQIPVFPQVRAVIAKPVPPMEVLYENGLLTIHSTRANLAQVLNEVHRATGAEIAIPAGADSEQVFTSIGPGAPKEVLAALLNGSHFNFIVVGSEQDKSGIRRVVLTPKDGGAPTEAVIYPCGSTQPAIAQAIPQQQPEQVTQAPTQVPDDGSAEAPQPAPEPAPQPQ